MAGLSGPAPFRIEADWDVPDDAEAFELAATWCALSIWVGDRCVTRVDASDSGVRRSVYTSAYPLAEWIVCNWWSLTEEVSPSAISSNHWTWDQYPRQEWLARHSFRAAGAGMPWPDLTLVPEGSTTAISWRGGAGLAGQPIRFIESGYTHLPSARVEEGLRKFVRQVLDRLSEANLESMLVREWLATQDVDAEEAAFSRAAAKLGLDPFAVPDRIADDLIAVSEDVDPELLDEFLDSANPDELRRAVHWLQHARASVGRAQAAPAPVSDLRHDASTGASIAPWRRGYDLARSVRAELRAEPSDQFRVEDWVGQELIDEPAAGLAGYVGVDAGDKVGLVLPKRLSHTAQRFSRARALGLALSGSRREFLLDSAHTDLPRLSRAFAAELLAPAAGIAALLASVRAVTDDDLDEVGNWYGVSPLLVRHQYENQLASID